MGATGIQQRRRRAQVWFGSYAIIDQVAEPSERFEVAMRRRFVSRRVTNEPLTAGWVGVVVRLMAAATRHRSQAVSMKRQLEYRTGVRVLIAGPPP